MKWGSLLAGAPKWELLFHRIGVSPGRFRLFSLLPLGLFLAATGVVCPASSPEPAAAPLPELRVDYVAPLASSTEMSDNSLIFSDDFDSDAPLAPRYFEYTDEHGSFVRDPNAGYGGSGGAMRARFEKGQVAAGTLKVLFGRSPFPNRGVRRDETFREIYWRVYVKHEAGWQGNPAKLVRATCLASPDWTQGFIAHVWGGKDDTLCIDPATGITDSRKVTTHYNDFDHLRWLGSRSASTPLFSPAESGRWVLIESHVRLNDPGQKNGVFELWIDGKLEASRDDLDWQGTWSDYAIDAVFLENYWNTGALKRETRWFDNFAIGTRRIGPITAPRNPMMVLNRAPGGPWQAEIVSGPEGIHPVWISKPIPGGVDRLKVEKKNGDFQGTLAGQSRLESGSVYWIRIHESRNEGDASGWSPCHSPFRT